MKNIFVLFVMFLLFLLSSCITKETEFIAETIIINDSGNDVTYTAYGVHVSDDLAFPREKLIKLMDKEEVTEKRTGLGGVTAFPFSSDSVIILFDDKKILKYRFEIDPENDRSPYSERAYGVKQLGDYHHEYTYTITKEDYERAIPIKNN